MVIEQLQTRANELTAQKNAIEARYNELNIELGNRRAAETERANQATELLQQKRNEIEAFVNKANINIATRKMEYAHQENLLSIQNQQEHWQYSDLTQRIGTVGGLATDVVSSIMSKNSLLAGMLAG